MKPNYTDQHRILLELKKILDNSAIMKRDIPLKYVPTKEIFHKIYDLLFKSTLYRKSYLKILEEYDGKTAEHHESKLMIKIQGYILKIKSAKDIPALIVQKIRSIRPFALKIAVTYTLLIMVNLSQLGCAPNRINRLIKPITINGSQVTSKNEWGNFIIKEVKKDGTTIIYIDKGDDGKIDKLIFNRSHFDFSTPGQQLLRKDAQLRYHDFKAILMGKMLRNVLKKH